MPSMSRVELYAAIRRDSRVGGLSGRELARKYRVRRRTVALALSSAWPEPRKKLPPRTSRLDPRKAEIDRILRADLDAPRKQRHTTKRIFERLVAEHDGTGTPSPIRWSGLMSRSASRRSGSRRAAGRRRCSSRRPTSPARTPRSISGRLRRSGRGAHLVLHVRVPVVVLWQGGAPRFGFGGAGGVLRGPCPRFQRAGRCACREGALRQPEIRGGPRARLHRARVETERWAAFRSWAGIDAFYCQPGLQGVHEKGGVEGEIGWFRRNHLVPVPQAATLAELNARIDRGTSRTSSAGSATGRAPSGSYSRWRGRCWAAAAGSLRDRAMLTPRVDRYAQVTVRIDRYSVPSGWSAARCGCCCTHRI